MEGKRCTSVPTVATTILSTGTLHEMSAVEQRDISEEVGTLSVF